MRSPWVDTPPCRISAILSLFCNPSAFKRSPSFANVYGSLSAQISKSDSDLVLNLAVSLSQRLITTLVMASLFSVLTGCTPLKQYRTARPPYPQGQPNAPTNILEQGRDYL